MAIDEQGSFTLATSFYADADGKVRLSDTWTPNEGKLQV